VGREAQRRHRPTSNVGTVVERQEVKTMAVQTSIAQPAGVVRTGLIGMALIAAVAFSAGLGLGASSWPAQAGRPEAVQQAVPTFDAVGFRASERLLSIGPAPTFDAVGFRASEKLR
jgi:hypothetical protein